MLLLHWAGKESRRPNGYFVFRMYDIVIVGNGPAGLSCAITARMRGLSTLLVGPQRADTWLARAERIDNYPGLPAVSGEALLTAFRAQALSLGAQERAGLVRQIMPNDGAFMLLVDSDVVEAKTVLLAMGAARPKLLAGEEALVGMGVSYCATCDGMLYRGKNIAVLSASEEGAEETHFLAGLAAGLDYYALKKHATQGLPANVRLMADAPVSLSRTPQGVAVATAQGERSYDGVFIFRSAVALSMLLSDLRTEGSFIPVDRGMRTNVPGVFAAGDCTGKPLQVAKAVGEGNAAAISAAEAIAARG